MSDIIKNKELVLVEKKELVTTSLIIASGFDKDHRRVTELIRIYKKEISSLGTFTVQTEKSKGRPTEYYILNEDQAMFLITNFRNNEKVIKFKLELVRSFGKLRRALSNIKSMQSNDSWKEQKKNNVISRKQETDTIKEFVNYAVIQGSNNAYRYYSNISKMENKTLFFLEQKFPNVRDVLTGQQLFVLGAADQLISKALTDGMNDNMNYKDIYKMAKERLEIFASVMPKTIVPMIDSKELN